MSGGMSWWHDGHGDIPFEHYKTIYELSKRLEGLVL
jgi:hypothetical protein